LVVVIEPCAANDTDNKRRHRPRLGSGPAGL